MNKNEFLKILKESLLMSLDENAISEQLDYYDRYISDEVKNGKTEKEVIEELGDPRLIAKTIKTVKQSDKSTGDTSSSSGNYNSEKRNTYSQNERRGPNPNVYYGQTGVIGCVIVALVIFIIIYAILRFLGSVAYGMGALAFSGPLGFMIVIGLIYLLFYSGRGR